MKTNRLLNIRDRYIVMSHISLLVRIAKADGHFDNSELQIIIEKGYKAGLNINELKNIIIGSQSEGFIPPEKLSEKVEHIYDMVLVMMADGRINDKELDICKGIAVKLGFNNVIIDKVLNELIDKVRSGEEPSATIQELICIAS